MSVVLFVWPCPCVSCVLLAFVVPEQVLSQRRQTPQEHGLHQNFLNIFVVSKSCSNLLLNIAKINPNPTSNVFFFSPKIEAVTSSGHHIAGEADLDGSPKEVCEPMGVPRVCADVGLRVGLEMRGNTATCRGMLQRDSDPLRLHVLIFLTRTSGCLASVCDLVCFLSASALDTTCTDRRPLCLGQYH